MLTIEKENNRDIKPKIKYEGKDIRISLIRIIATIGIVACHIFQEYGSELANWFNVNVQVFLFMSGFLYGNKTIENKILWIKNRLIRILVPYYMFLILAIIIYMIFGSNLISFSNTFTNILCLQLFWDGIPGLGHLWFIPLILFCYIITPLLQSVKNKISKNKKYFILIFLVIIIIHSLIMIPTIKMRYITSIITYIIGYFISTYYQENKKVKKISTIIITAIAILLVILELIMPTFMNNKIIYKILNFAIYYRNLFLGIAIFMILYNLIEVIRKNKLYYYNKSLIKIDSYTFYVYITHGIWILGPLSLLAITNNIIMNFIITFTIIIVNTVILKYISDKVIAKFQK